jgi:hypothetical protein
VISVSDTLGVTRQLLGFGLRFGLLDLARQPNHAIIGIDVDVVRAYLRIASQLGLDLGGDGGVVELLAHRLGARAAERE